MNVTGNKRDVSFIIDKYFALKKYERSLTEGARYFIVFIAYNEFEGTLAVGEKFLFK